MNILEKEIEEIIYEVAEDEPYELVKRGLYAPQNATWYRQLQLGAYGVADLVAVTIFPKKRGYREVFVDIYELKKDQINVGTLLQAMKYGKAIEQIIRSHLKRTSIHFKFLLVGRKVDRSGDFIYMPDLLDNVYMYEYNIDFFKGLSFKQMNGFALSQGNLPKASIFFGDMVEQLYMQAGPPPFIPSSIQPIEDLPF